jgi:7-carboxy-7-deazaguanine synthase
VARLHDAGFMVAMETNGTRWLPAGLDWVTVSPKAGARLHVRAGDELKVVWPQSLDLDELAGLPFPHRWLQPNARDPASAAICVRACLADPRWRLSVQVQKVLGIP